MGTGGGSGAPENFSDWNERDGEIFADYGPWMGKRDDLAWIYMLDKEIGFCFNNEHDPPPAESVLEDGRTDKRSPPDKISGSAAKKNKGNNNMCEVMNNGFQLMSTLFEEQNKKEQQSTSSMKDAGIAIDLIERLRSELERLKKENGSKRRVKRVQKALAHAYKKLGDVESESDVSSVSSESVKCFRHE